LLLGDPRQVFFGVMKMAAQKAIIEGSSVTALQLKDLFRQIADGSLTGDHVQAMLAHRNPFGEKEVPKKLSVLKALDDITVGPLNEAFDHRKFFKTRKGLWVSDDFTSRTKGIGVCTKSLSLKRFNLVKDAYDREIKSELPQQHEVQLWHIAKLIEAQEGGTDGPLLNDGYWNIFYVAGFVVHVSWNGGRREWYVYAWRLDGSRWHARRRVFSSN
jgi:hypothetical protein